MYYTVVVLVLLSVVLPAAKKEKGRNERDLSGRKLLIKIIWWALGMAALSSFFCYFSSARYAEHQEEREKGLIHYYFLQQ